MEFFNLAVATMYIHCTMVSVLNATTCRMAHDTGSLPLPYSIGKQQHIRRKKKTKWNKYKFISAKQENKQRYHIWKHVSKLHIKCVQIRHMASLKQTERVRANGEKTTQRQMPFLSRSDGKIPPSLLSCLGFFCLCSLSDNLHLQALVLFEW